MIPTARPVVGKDLDSIAQQFGMLTADACWVFGMSITKWMHIVRQAPDTPLKDPTLALLVRFLDKHPELQPIPVLPTAADMFELINKVQPVDQKRFSVMFGSEASATYRWLKTGSRMSPAVGRLMHHMRIVMQAASPTKRTALLDDWRLTVRSEAQARGVDDIFQTGAWKPKEAPSAEVIAAKKAAKQAAKAAAGPTAKPAKASPTRKRTAKAVPA